MSLVLPSLSQPSPAKRPKLTLNTSNLVVSLPPTLGKASTSLTLDTLSATSPTARNTFCNGYYHKSFPSSPPDDSGTSPASTLSTADSLGTPYTLSSSVPSILSNSPLAASTRAPRTAAKRVAFRAPLEEIIQTAKYTMAHYDLACSEPRLSAARQEEGEAHKAALRRSSKADDDEPNDDSNDDDEHNIMYPVTPVAGRRKRHRQWRWTLE